jgi:hypothetical protein
MNATSAVPRLLAVLSVGFFWVLPVSPLVALAALRATKGSPRTPHRKLAVAGAILSSVFTVFVAAVVMWDAIQLL